MSVGGRKESLMYLEASSRDRRVPVSAQPSVFGRTLRISLQVSGAPELLSFSALLGC